MMDAFDKIGLSPEQTERWRQAWAEMSVTIGSAASAFQAIAEALRPTMTEIVNTWSNLQRAHLVPRQHRMSIMRKKIRRAYRVP